ncbi:MAG TPA: ABC transporter permease [Acidimicrobiales bacterium]|nr:ABC transporter permease [Acidimicrobiales bacterium]
MSAVGLGPISMRATGSKGSERLRSGVRLFFSIREGLIGSVVLGAILLLVIVGPHVAPYDPNAIGTQVMANWSAEHLLGTDTYGRDVLSRVLNGGGSVILLPLAGIALSASVATPIALSSGYLGGKVDLAIGRVLDAGLAIPSYLTAIVVISGFGTNDLVLVVVVAVVYAPSMARVLRGATQAVAPKDFVLAAKARGESRAYILSREVLPNIAPTLLVEVAIRLTYAIIFVATLSYLGLGVQPPSSNWGVMVSENRAMLLLHPVIVIIPAILIALLAISINLIADALTRVFGDRIVDPVMM